MKRVWLVVGGAVLVVMLAAAAYVGGRLLNSRNVQAAPDGGGPQLTLKGGGKGEQTYKLKLEPAKELPASPMDVKGIFVRRADSSIFIGTGQVSISAQKNPDGTINMSSKHDGPEVEVVVSHDTTVYQDVTQRQFNGEFPSGSQAVQQVLEPGSADEIGQDSAVQVWGERRGDRVVARVLVYSPPAILIKAGGAPSGK